MTISYWGKKVGEKWLSFLQVTNIFPDYISTGFYLSRLGLLTQRVIKDFNLFIKQCYCIIWSINSKNPKVQNINKGKLLILTKSGKCDNKKSRFIKEQEASGLLSSLGIKIPLSQIPLVGPILS